MYGIPPEQVVGSSIETRYEVREGKPVIDMARDWRVIYPFQADE